jgi:hypothetical protein
VKTGVLKMRRSRTNNQTPLDKLFNRQEITQVKGQLDKYAALNFQSFLNNLNEMNDAILRAQQAAECLLANDPFKAWSGEKEKSRGRRF